MVDTTRNSGSAYRLAKSLEPALVFGENRVREWKVGLTVGINWYFILCRDLLPVYLNRECLLFPTVAHSHFRWHIIAEVIV